MALNHRMGFPVGGCIDRVMPGFEYEGCGCLEVLRVAGQKSGQWGGYAATALGQESRSATGWMSDVGVAREVATGTQPAAVLRQR
jgi:hypothetical protein